ncbi:MAG: tautomerase family protein [Gammaproteobacteria bacterium]
MPLVNISILKGKSAAYKKAVADAVNSSVIETMNFPDDDRYQIIHEHEPADLELQERTGDRVMMYLIMRSGRPDAAKQAFYARVVEKLAQDPGIEPANVLISIVENKDIDWSFRDGIAQFVV